MKYIWRIIKFTKELWGYYLVVSLVSILVAIMSLVIPLFSGWAIDEIRLGSDANMTYILWLVTGIFLLDLGTTLFSNFGGYVGDLMQARLQRTLSTKYYQHILTLPQQFFDTELSGKIINRLNRSIAQISNFMQMWSNNFLQFVFNTIFSLVVVFIYSWEIALLLFALYPIYVWMTVKTSGRWMQYQEKINQKWDIATGRFAESISQVKVVKSFIQEKHELKFFDKNYKDIVRTAKPQSKLWHKKDIQRRVLLNIIFYAVYILIFVQTARGSFTPGQAVTLILYAMQIRIPIFTISFLVENTQRAVADSKDYFEIMNLEPQITDKPDAVPIKVSEGRISFSNVTFAYDQSKVLSSLSFEVSPDTKVALVGESGEGKTTITNLLMRLYEPSDGVITIDGQDINKVTQQSLRRSIGVVFQDPALFSGSIRENIAYSRPTATDAEITAAAKAANAHEFISKFEKGYDTEIGERGLKLSGGQKQRIAIARAILKDAPILILDEATSSLDSRSEAMVQEALQRLMKGRTTLIIAHRLSTIAHVDKIITISGGKVDEQGSPVKLAKSGGIYSQLLDMQGSRAQTNLKKFEIKA